VKATNVVLLIIILTVIAAAMTVSRFGTKGNSAAPKPLTDLPMFHSAARAVAVGANAWNTDTLRMYSADIEPDRVNPFPYTPVITLLLKPFVRLSTANLQPWWLAFSCLAASVSVIVAFHIVRTVLPSIGTSWLFIPIMTLVVAPFQFALLNGQLDVLLGCILLLAWWHAPDRPMLAGLMLAAVLCTKHALAPIVGLFLVAGKGPRHTVAWALVCTLAIVGITVILQGTRPWLQWLDFTLAFGEGNLQGLTLGVPFNLSLQGLAARWQWSSAGLLRIIAPLLSVLALLYLAYSRRIAKSDSYGRLVWFGIGVVAAAWIMPFCWSHHLLAATASLMALCFNRNGTPAPFRIAGVILAIQCAPGMLVVRAVEALLQTSIADTMALSGCIGVVALVVMQTSVVTQKKSISTKDAQ
jgi:Glycosyltransferase family 87